MAIMMYRHKNAVILIIHWYLLMDVKVGLYILYQIVIKLTIVPAFALGYLITYEYDETMMGALLL